MTTAKKIRKVATRKKEDKSGGWVNMWFDKNGIMWADYHVSSEGMALMAAVLLQEATRPLIARRKSRGH